jgi:hypothetical protein
VTPQNFEQFAEEAGFSEPNRVKRRALELAEAIISTLLKVETYIDFNVRKPPAQCVPLNFEPSQKD